jgi:hypothetical protein
MGLHQDIVEMQGVGRRDKQIAAREVAAKGALRDADRGNVDGVAMPDPDDRPGSASLGDDGIADL